MSNGFSGADVEHLRALSSRLKAQSGKLREISSSSSAALLAAQWTGNDIDAIRDNWKQRSLPRLTGLADSLHQMGAELDRQAHQQEQASGAAAGSAGASFASFSTAFAGIVGGIARVLPNVATDVGGPGATSGLASENPESGSTSSVSTGGAAISEMNVERLEHWRNGVPNGTKIDWDGAYGVQCVDVVRHYLNSVFPGEKVTGGFDHAFQMYAAADSQYFEKIPPTGAPQPGDIIVIGKNTYSPDSGHVAIVDSVDSSGRVHVIQQSGGAQKSGVFEGGMSAIEMNACVGYLRPKA